MDYIFYLFIISASIQLLYYWVIFSKLAFYKQKNINKNSLPVSIVISAKNEYAKLKKYLPEILEQDYENFEVVVVNDCSDDETNFLLRIIGEKYPHLKVVNIHKNVNFFSGKKFPLSVGIKSAKHDIVLLTDADCKPAGKNWLRLMQSSYYENTDIVLGYGAYFKKNGLLNKLVRYDTLNIAIQYFSFALAGFAYMGVGRNLSYRKKLFFDNKGFTSHYNITSGDDDLFINRVANKKNVSIQIDIESHTYSEPKITFSSWLAQKKRHISTSKYYKLKHKILLGGFSLTQVLFFASLIVCGINYENFLELRYSITIISLLIIRLSTQLIINKYCINKLNERNLLLFSPIFELTILVINIYLYFINLIIKTNKWK